MADRSAIEWTDASWNPIRARNKATGKVGWHCEHATTGCEFCYAEGFNMRLGTKLPFKPGHRKDIEIFLDETMLTQPLRWKKPRKIFVGSMTDLFADFVTDEWIDKVFAVMALAPQHTFQVLTKRAGRMREYLASDRQNVVAWKPVHEVMNLWYPGWIAEDVQGPHRSRAIAAACTWPLPNVWLGVSTERQQEADERIPLLLQTPAAVRFISAEPLLGPIDLRNLGDATFSLSAFTGEAKHLLGMRDKTAGKLDWVIAGGESGPKARPMHPDWVRSLRDQCASAGVPFFKKQWGEYLPWSQFVASGIEDGEPSECTRFRTMQWDGECWTDEGFPSWIDSDDGSIDDEQCVGRVGKKKAGRLLDGVEHNEFPTTRAM